MQTGQRIRVKWDGGTGTIVRLIGSDALLRMDEPDEDGVTEYRERLSEIEPLEPERTQSDFDGGFGIGGLGRFEEKSVIPSAEQIRREDARIAELQRCRKCGQLEGDVMFTTDPDRHICDDCFG